MEKEKLSVLIEQYKIYSDLYKHEDNLTWVKVHKMVVLMAALLTIFGLSINISHLLAIIVAAFGAIISVIFFFTIGNGAIFTALRRENFIEVENSLINHDALNISSKDEENINKILNERIWFYKIARKIKTQHMLITLPIIMSISWIGLIIFVVNCNDLNTKPLKKVLVEKVIYNDGTKNNNGGVGDLTSENKKR